MGFVFTFFPPFQSLDGAKSHSFWPLNARLRKLFEALNGRNSTSDAKSEANSLWKSEITQGKVARPIRIKYKHENIKPKRFQRQRAATQVLSRMTDYS